MPVGFEVSAMKASFSLSSLEPSGGLLAESPEHARLRMEKPYNSLTKKPRRAWDSEVENWRRSWGGRDNEDSFLEALLPNYTFLMDNNLIDTCKEADGELCMDHKWQLLEEVAREGKVSASQVETLCQEAVEKEIRCLRRWIRGMEKRLHPLDFKIGFALTELEEKAKEIQCLAVEIEAQGKVVASLKHHCECLVAASTPENQEHQHQQGKQQCPIEEDHPEGKEREKGGQAPPSGEEAASPPVALRRRGQAPPKGSAAESLKVAHLLEGRWHHLFLRALEWQVHIESLLSGNGPKFKRRRESNTNGDGHSLDSGAEHSSLSSEGEEEDSCSGEEGQRGGRGEEGRGVEGRGVGGGGGARRVGGREDGGPRPKQPRLGAEETLGEGGKDEERSGGREPQGSKPSQVMEVTDTASERKIFPTPKFGSIDQGLSPSLVKRVNMRESPHSERVLSSSRNCAYFVIRRIDTDSEAEAKENGAGVEGESGGGSPSNGDGVGSKGKVLGETEAAVNQDEEEEGDEEDDEWVFSRVTTKAPSFEEKDTKAKKSLQYGILEGGENGTDAEERDELKSYGQVCESLKLNPTPSDVGTKEKNARIKRWLKQGGPAAAATEESAESQEEQVSKRCPIDSCDASGEYTSSGESSEVESQSSGELDGSIATCRKSSAVAAVALSTSGWNPKVSPLSAQELGISSLSLSPTDGDITPVVEARALPELSAVSISPTGKLVLRNKRRKGKLSSHHQHSPKSEQKRRPWSICVSGPSQLVAISSDKSCMNTSPMQGTSFSASPSPNSPHHTQMHSARSTSESAIHCLAYSSSSCSTGLDDVGSAAGRAGTGSDGLTPTRGSMDGEGGVGSGGGLPSTGSLRRKKVRTRRRTLDQRSESGNSDSMPGEKTCLMRRGSRLSGKGMSPGSKGSLSQSTSSDYSSSNVVGDETKDELDDGGSSGHCKEVWGRCGMGEVTQEDDDNEVEGEKLGSLQTEETSSFSEQAWDNYQVCLSEGGDYSSDDDKPEKEQLLKRLMDFGDDYRNHFDSQSDGGSSLARQPPTPCSTLDSYPGDGIHSLPRSHSPTPPSPGSSSRTGSGHRKRQTLPVSSSVSRIRQSLPEVAPSSKFLPPLPLISHGPPSLGPMVNLIDDLGTCNPASVLDSDSDLEELNYLLQESRTQIAYVESMLDKTLGGGLSLTTPGKFHPPAGYAEIAATCKENIKGLRALLRSVSGMDGQEGILFTPRDFWEMKDLVQRWEMLESRAEECHQLRGLRQEIAALRDAMVAPSSGEIRNGKVEDLQNRKELDRRIQEVKAEIAALLELKNELLDVNVSVNRFLTGAAQPIQCPSVTTSGSIVAPGASSSEGRDAGAEVSGSRIEFAFLKEEVAELYREWDESLSRLNAELAALQRASRTWAELEEGLSSLGSALDSDRSTLAALSTAVAAARSPRRQSSMASGDRALPTPALLAASVRDLARVLSEEKGPPKQTPAAPRSDKDDEDDEWDANGFVEATDLDGGAHVNFKHSGDPLGSLSDSGISDSGSEGLGQCERGRRLAALRKLARVLAATLGSNSAPIVALKQRMDDAQKDLRSLQRTCRDLVVCTAMLCSACQDRGPKTEEGVSEAVGLGSNNSEDDGGLTNCNIPPSSEDEKLNRLRASPEEGKVPLGVRKQRSGGGGGGGRGEGGSVRREKGRSGKGRKHWLWRALCCAMPFQLAVVFLLYAAYFLEPHCCSALNNLSFSLSPQLHYVRGPPPT